MRGERSTGVQVAAAVAILGGIIAIVAVFVPAFRVSGQGVDATEKLFRDWEGKVGLATGAVMVAGGLLLWLPAVQSAARQLAALIVLAALVAIGSASYAIVVFHSKTLDALSAQFAQQQGASPAQVRPLLVAAIQGGVIKLEGKIGVPLLIVGAALAFFAGAYVLLARRSPSAVSPAQDAPALDTGPAN